MHAVIVVELLKHGDCREEPGMKYRNIHLAAASNVILALFADGGAIAQVREGLALLAGTL